ncbi:MAG: TonB-dependent receptor [Bacteroidales bacterium]|nr:TonB-dependent receptor [Bacteroidales bacterium]
MRKPALAILLLFITLGISAQDLRGRILEINEEGDTVPVVYAMVQWMNTSVGTFTDDDGTFALPRTTTDTLVISYAAYSTEKLRIGKEQDDLTFILSKGQTLDEVQVVSRDGSFISVEPILTSVITQQGLRRAACCNLAESFESTVAVDMEYSDAVTGAKQIAMLGLSGIYSQILLENVPYIRLLTQQFGLGFVPGAWMESISVSKGVASVSNGYEAITGQINVDFKKPETNQERLFLNLYGNTMGRGELNLNTRFNVGKQQRASTMLLLNAADQFAKMDMNKDGFLDVPRNQQVNVMNRWDYTIPEKLNGRTLVGFVWDNRVGGQKNYNWKRDYLSTEIYGIHLDNKRLDFITKNGILLKGADESIGTIASYTGTWTNGVFGLRTMEAQQHSAYLNILYSNKFGNSKRHKLTAGGSMQYDFFTCTIKNTSINGLEQYAYTNGTVHEAVPGVFGEYSYIIDRKLVVMAGMRLDYNFLYRQLFWTPRLHVKWQATESTAIRASAGKGYRSAYPEVENLSLLTSNRTFNLYAGESRRAEEAYNAGISLVQTFHMPGGIASVSVDYFYTHFIQQTLVDLDLDAHHVYMYNLNGAGNGTGNLSHSHSVQAEITLWPVARFEILLAYRYNDVRYQSQGQWRKKALMSPHKALVNLNYSTRYDKWKFNLTLQVNGPQRLPDMSGNTASTLPGYSPTYCILNGQITKKFRKWEIYAGAENMLNYKQKNPIVDAENPFGENFDTTVVYAPITGIMGYVGIRVVLK